MVQVDTNGIEKRVGSLDLGANEPRTPFGREFREKYFSFEDGVVNVNHGSYGAVPKCVINAKFEYLTKSFAFPEDHFKLNVDKKVNQVRAKVAEIVDADVESLVFVTNDTTGINSVLRNYPFQKGQAVVYCNTSFVACSSALKYLRDRVGIELIEVQIKYPMSNQEIVDAYTEAMDSHSNVKMALFDTTSSVPAAQLPWQTLCAECRKRDILSLVDGAHGIGLSEIKLRQARPDFFTSNLHKWFFTPVSLALLYVDKAHHEIINGVTISALYVPEPEIKSGSKKPLAFADKFCENGTVDVSNIQSVEDAIAFRNNICGGEKAIRDYCYKLAIDAANYMLKEFGTEILSGKQDTISNSMINVRVPLTAPPTQASQIVSAYTTYICNKWKTFVPLFYYNGAWWVRLSAQIYLDLDDFKHATKAVSDTLDHIKSTL
ncbi:hypothetical protein AWJ20_1152 [Sugiyamaella lignohabitans]|uniref:Aminotransferase class V domain-containing protein n=1 Tax=Sugiyamaella lignohabitans TaxID=796027 RepID=A0A167DFY2_9ASCO|nr:uncharacterized protein AWJ20_1152 [Sugiyamaella lignohabitans]ANB12874.1 hypothetical protein AWJ20_1152 [Sugiyamaella lignohabitans]